MIRYKKKIILITGGTGFIGSHLVEALVKKGYKVRCLVRNPNKLNYLRNLGVDFKDLGVDVVYGDITDRDSLLHAVKGVSTVVHLAGVLGKWGVPDKIYWDVHVRGTKLLLEACINEGVKRFIYCSSAGVLGPIKNPPANEDWPYNPSNVYEETKAVAEKLVLSYKNKMAVTIIRPEFVYGPRDMHVLKLFDAIQKGKFFIIGNGQTLLHPTYISDVIQAFLLCLENEKSIGKIYLITGETPVKVIELSTIIAEELGVPPPIFRIPKWLAYMAASLSEMLAQMFNFEPLITRSQVKFFTENRAFDNSKAKYELNYNPLPLRQGIRQTIRWYRQNGYLPVHLSFRNAYKLALAEGEGLGTAYEYVVKQRIIKKAINKLGFPKNVLIAGLPEKYGFSLDFIYFFDAIGARLVIVDEREKKLDEFNNILYWLKSQELFVNCKLSTLRLDIINLHNLNKVFDFAISCEVIQRLNKTDRIIYLKNLYSLAKNLILFAPNAKNVAHAKISKLNTLYLNEIVNLCSKVNYMPVDYGYIDTPPFPPGLKWSNSRSKKRKVNSIILKVLFKFLNTWAIMEKYIPKIILKNRSHMIYFVGKRRSDIDA